MSAPDRYEVRRQQEPGVVLIVDRITNTVLARSSTQVLNQLEQLVQLANKAWKESKP